MVHIIIFLKGNLGQRSGSIWIIYSIFFANINVIAQYIAIYNNISGKVLHEIKVSSIDKSVLATWEDFT